MYIYIQYIHSKHFEIIYNLICNSNTLIIVVVIILKCWFLFYEHR